MHYLVVGSKGMLGTCLCRVLSKAGQKVTGTDIEEFDITDYEDSRREIDKIQPDLMINCAAYTDVDGCEIRRDIAFAVNAAGPKNLATISSRMGIKIIHISTDFVFDGQKKSPYLEADRTAPLGVYGKSKLKGEEALAEAAKDFLIVRTSWLYGREGKNFVKTILQLAGERDHLEVVDDQRGSPTYALDLAEALLDFSKVRHSGIVHFSNSGDCTWYDFACRIVSYAGLKVPVRPVTSGRMPRPAKRPSYSVLDLTAATRLLGRSPRRWDEALRDFMQHQ